MELEFPRSISDGYPEYVDDELGYHYHAWEVISASESTRHERIRLAQAQELEELAEHFAPLSDLERWALGRHYLRNGQVDRYFKFVEPILQGERTHRALHYPEIFADFARRHAEGGDMDAADATVGRIEQVWPELAPAIPLLRAKLLLRAGRFDEAHQAYEKEIEAEDLSDDEAPEIYFEAAFDFFECGATEIARHWLDRSRQAAEESGDTATMVDIELLEAELTEAQKAPESPQDRP